MTQDGSHFSLQRSLFQLPEIPGQINVGDFKCSPNTLGVNLQLLSSSREMWDSDGLQALYLLDLVARTAALLFIVDICSALHYLSHATASTPPSLRALLRPALLRELSASSILV